MILFDKNNRNLALAQLVEEDFSSDAGGPSMLSVPATIYDVPFGTNTGTTGWTTYDLSSYVPEGTEYVIVQSTGYIDQPDGGSFGANGILKFRDILGGVHHTGLLGRSSGGGDYTAGNNQGIYKIDKNTRTFQYRVLQRFNRGLNVQLMGYFARSLNSGGDSGLISETIVTYDLTNGGQLDMNNLDINWQPSWDDYYKVEIIAEDVQKSTSGQVGFALAGAANPGVWLELAGTGSEGLLPTSTSIPANSQLEMSATITVGSHYKNVTFQTFAAQGIRANSPNDFGPGGHRTSYNGVSFGNTTTGATHWEGWDTSSPGLSGFILRFGHEGASPFVSGRVTLVGHRIV